MLFLERHVSSCTPVALTRKKHVLVFYSADMEPTKELDGEEHFPLVEFFSFLVAWG
ncbi:MAG: hypothetical protein ACI83D_000612 [Planctomycetota bacterium]|jgi:hypothetical protein